MSAVEFHDYLRLYTLSALFFEAFGLSVIFSALLVDLHKDKSRYGFRWWRHSGFWVVFSYRVRRHRKFSHPLARILLLPFDVIFAVFLRCFVSMRLPSSVPIGAGLYLPHPEGIFINGKAVIGSGVSLFQQVTVGEWNDGAPHIGDGCSLFAGAKVFGAVSIGSHSAIGANAVVNFDVPAGSTVAASRSVLISKRQPD